MELPSQLVAELGKVRTVGIITGAGLSAESGVANFRDHRAFEDPDDPLNALGSHAWDTRPDAVRAVLSDLTEAAMKAEPNAGHIAIHAIEQKVQRCVLLTQNIDSLHERAGSENPILANGDLFTLECERCRNTVQRIDAVKTPGGPPVCPRCGHDQLRPEVSLFAEFLTAIRVLRLHDGFLHEPPDLLLLVGTSKGFPYIVQPLAKSTEADRLTVEVSARKTDMTGLVDFSIRGSASEWLPRIADAIPVTKSS